jgi:hypothetical protein
MLVVVIVVHVIWLSLPLDIFIRLHQSGCIVMQRNCCIQVELSHKKHAAGERRILELEAQLALAVEESSSLKDHINSMEGKVLEVPNLKHQLELMEHCYTQAQQKIKVNILVYKCE